MTRELPDHILEWERCGAPVVERAKREILADMIAGRVPPAVRSFAELHDYVDANGYGGAFEEDFDGSDAATYFWNRVQNEVDAWLRRRTSTCGPVYQEGLTKYGGGDPHRAFAAGFVSGQAEKVYLGACAACMLRPSAAYWDSAVLLAADVAGRYGLRLATLDDEIWLCRTEAVVAAVHALCDVSRNSYTWHRTRADLCGVAPDELDPDFHRRAGYRGDCDIPPGRPGA